MTIQFSRRLAIVGGLLMPLGETIRRWSTWREYPPSLFDDYILGAFLLYAAWRTRRDVRGGQPTLAAAWGFACGLGYYSFFGQLKASARANPTLPAFLPSGCWALRASPSRWQSRRSS